MADNGDPIDIDSQPNSESTSTTALISTTNHYTPLFFFLQYGIGLPLGSFLLLYKFRHRLHTDKFRFRLGLLYSGYRRDRWWWENVVAARKVIIICFSSIWFNETIQVHLVLGLMMVLLVRKFCSEIIFG